MGDEAVASETALPLWGQPVEARVVSSRYVQAMSAQRPKQWWRAPQPALRHPFGTAVIGALIVTVLGWRTVPDVPYAGLDASWAAALHMAAHRNLEWGHDLVFTYGPLGWLRDPRFWYEDTGRLALAYSFVTRVAAVAALCALASRTFGRLGALLLLLPIAKLLDDPVTALGFAGAASILIDSRSRGRTEAVIAGLGVLGGLELLGKISAGVLVVACSAVAICFVASRREVVRLSLIWTAAFALGLVGSWLLSGQDLGNLWSYSRNAVEIVSGYSEAMQSVAPAGRVQYLAALGFWGAGVCALAFGCSVAGRQRTGLMVLWTVYVYVSFKSGFVRHDAGHAAVFFSALMPALVVLPWRRRFLERSAAVGVVALAAYSCAHVSGLSVKTLLTPMENARAAGHQLRPLWDAGRRRELVDRGLFGVAISTRLDPSTSGALRGRTVTVTPSELDVIWVNRLRWAPEPVLQGYQAYTSRLAALNAHKLVSSSAPERILVGPNVSIDTRIASFDTPAEAIAQVCRYRPVVRQADVWLVLARRRYGCSTPRLLSSARADWGEAVRVPSPTRSEIILARVRGAGVAGLERLRSAVFRSHERTLDLGAAGLHRVVPAALGDGIPVRSGVDADFPGPFAIAPDGQSMSVDRGDHPRGGRPLTYDFLSVQVDGWVLDTRRSR